MSFMEKQITDKRFWIEIDTSHGTVFVDAMDAPQTALDFIEACNDGLHESDEVPATVACDLLDYTEVFDANDIYSVSGTEGYGVRMSAPGYMDCTEWAVFESVQEAKDYLEEIDKEVQDEE